MSFFCFAQDLKVGDHLRFEFNDPIGRLTGKYKVYVHTITDLSINYHRKIVRVTTDKDSQFTYNYDEIVPGYYEVCADWEPLPVWNNMKVMP